MKRENLIIEIPYNVNGEEKARYKKIYIGSVFVKEFTNSQTGSIFQVREIVFDIIPENLEKYKIKIEDVKDRE